MILGDYDLQIIVAVVFAATLFSGFMYLYAQEPTLDYTSPGNTSMDWDAPQDASAISGVFGLLGTFGVVENFLVGLFVSAMIIVGSIIGIRFLRGQ